MTDLKSLPDNHVLKTLELRLLEMAADMGPLMVAGGSFVAALRVFAGLHPGLVDRTIHCEECGTSGPEFPPAGWTGAWNGDSESFVCPDCAKVAA